MTKNTEPTTTKTTDAGANAGAGGGTIELKPRGLELPGGAQRINAAVEALSKAETVCARLLDELHSEIAGCARPNDAWRAMRDEIKTAVIARRNASEEFLRAMCGAPPMVVQ